MGTANPTFFTLYKNTKFHDMQNTLHFSSNDERNRWFNDIEANTNGKVTALKISTPFNFRRDRGVVKVSMNFDDIKDVNYCQFIDRKGEVYYAFVASVSYLSENVTRLDIVIDPIMTFCQGDFLQGQSCEVLRQHLRGGDLNNYKEILRNNDDYIPATSMRYVYGDSIIFNNFTVLITSAVDLSKDFGKESAPKMSTSSGATIDGNTSPCDLYTCTFDDFPKIMDFLGDYPWITQNFKDITLIPTSIIPEAKLSTVTNSKVSGFPSGIKRVENGAEGLMINSSKFSISLQRLRELLRVPTPSSAYNDIYVRDGLMTIEVTDHRGGKIIISPSQVGDNGISLNIESVFGYTNEIILYDTCTGNRSANISAYDKLTHYMDNSLSLDNFDHLPMLIDNSTLAKANTAYSRQVQDSRQLSGKTGTLFNKNSSLKDKIYSGMSIYSDVFAGNFGGGLVSGLIGSTAKAANLWKNEYEYEQDKAAQFKQWDITPPSVTSGTYGSSIMRKTNSFGFVLKIATAPIDTVNANVYYHGRYGYDMSSIGVYQVPIFRKSSICDWYQLKCNFHKDNIDNAFNIQIANLLEGGIRFFYDYDKIGNWNPMNNTPYIY